MLEKLSVSQFVRYFFSGVAVVVAIGIARGVTIPNAIDWMKSNDWASHFSPTAVIAILILVIGYYSFTIYRTLGYEWIILSLKGGLARLPWIGRHFYSYRELIRDQLDSRVTVWEAERIYRVLRRKIAPDFYDSSVDSITSGLHLLYLTTLVLVITSLSACREQDAAGSLFLFLLVLAFDVHFERQELLYFWGKRNELRTELMAFRNHPAWRDSD